MIQCVRAFGFSGASRADRVPARRFRRGVAYILVFLFPACFAVAASAPPPTLEAIVSAVPSRTIEAAFGAERRAAAMRTSAIGYGARAGLARRSWELQVMLDRHGPQLSNIYRFGDLLLTRDGFEVLPPVAAESRRAFRLARDGAQAAAARRVLRIVVPERIVSAAPTWRDYLVRSWAPAEAPVSVLFPRTDAERRRWRAWIEEGWALGRALADDIFASDLDLLNRDFEGIVLWRRLHLARMAGAPVVEARSAAVSGGGDVMRIGETFARLGPPVRLNPRVSEWRVLVEDRADAR